MNILKCLFCEYVFDEHVLWVGFPLFNHVSFFPWYLTLHTVINPTTPCCIQHHSALPPTLTKKKRKLFHLPNPFIHGLQVISPYSRHNPGPSGRGRETERERERKWKKRKDHMETATGRQQHIETQRGRREENTERSKDTERNKKHGDKQQCC